MIGHKRACVVRKASGGCEVPRLASGSGFEVGEIWDEGHAGEDPSDGIEDPDRLIESLEEEFAIVGGEV